MTHPSVCVVSETGRRPANQDRACAETTTVAGGPALILAVADGMGGMVAGDRAADIAIATVREYAQNVFPGVSQAEGGVGHALWRMFQDANARTFQWAKSEGCGGNTGSTLVCCLVFGNRYLVANAGDSRCYYLNDEEVRLLTEDHSRVQEMVRQGLMTPEAAGRSPFRNELTNSLGEPHEITVDIVPDPGRPGVIDEPCVLLLTSDGLHGYVSHDELLGTVRTSATVTEAGARIVALALAKGSTDNATIAMFEFGRLKSRVPAPQATTVLNTPVVAKTVKIQRRSTPRRATRRTRIAVVVLLATVVTAGAAVAFVQPLAARMRTSLPAWMAAWVYPGPASPPAPALPPSAQASDARSTSTTASASPQHVPPLSSHALAPSPVDPGWLPSSTAGVETSPGNAREWDAALTVRR